MYSPYFLKKCKNCKSGHVSQNTVDWKNTEIHSYIPEFSSGKPAGLSPKAILKLTFKNYCIILLAYANNGIDLCPDRQNAGE